MQCPVVSTSTHYIAIAPCDMVIVSGYFTCGTVANSTQTATLMTGNDSAAAASLDVTITSASFAVGSGTTAGICARISMSSSHNRLRAGEPIAIKFSATATSLANGIVALLYTIPKTQLT